MRKILMRILTLVLFFSVILSLSALSRRSMNDICALEKAADTSVADSDPLNSSAEVAPATNRVSNDGSVPENTLSNPSLNSYYKPTSVTISLYDTLTSTYGFTWNSVFEPIDPVIQICEGSVFKSDACKEYKATVHAETTYMPGKTSIFVCKAEAALKQDVTYTYRAYDKGAQVASRSATIKTGNPVASSFTFVHVSDSQVKSANNNYLGVGTGECFSDTLIGIMQTKPDFIIHTGDFVEYSKYEGYWTNMIDFNAQYLMQVPVMALSGNHETSYLAGTNETFKHFNNKIPSQANTDHGYYYSFDYGNAKFIMLNTNNIENNRLENEQYLWLLNELENNNKKWTIVSMHNPVFSIGKYGSDPKRNSISVGLRSQLVKAFADYHVDLVLQGHDHAYSVTYPVNAKGKADTSSAYEIINSVKYAVDPAGTIYSMHGPAGNQNRSPHDDYNSNFFQIAAGSKESSWAEVSIEDNRLTVHIRYYENGTVNTFESYGVLKSKCDTDSINN